MYTLFPTSTNSPKMETTYPTTSPPLPQSAETEPVIHGTYPIPIPSLIESSSSCRTSPTSAIAVRHRSAVPACWHVTWVNCTHRSGTTVATAGEVSIRRRTSPSTERSMDLNRSNVPSAGSCSNATPHWWVTSSVTI